MGHIELSRSADLVVVAPATADLMAKLARRARPTTSPSTLLLATDKRVLLAPAMNVRMWLHPATRRNLAALRGRRRAGGRPGRGRDGLRRVRPGPDGRAAGDRRRDRRGARPAGALAGAARAGHLGADARADRPGALHRQPLVRAAGHARSPRRWRAAARASPSSPARPRRRGRSARRWSRSRPRARCSRRSRRRCRPTPRSSPRRSPTGGWPRPAARKIKKDASGRAAGAGAGREPRHPAHASRSGADGRPRLVVGFAAETDDVVANASAKRLRKGCDWIVANDVQPGDRDHGRRARTR